MFLRGLIRRQPARALLLLAIAGTFVLAFGAVRASAATITPHGRVTLVWDATDLATQQLGNTVMVMPIAPTALVPASHSVKLTFPIAGGTFATTSPYWGPVKLGGGIRFLKLVPASSWTQVRVTKLLFNIRTQAVTASINGAPPVRFADVNEMGMTDRRFRSHGHVFVRIRGALLFYSSAARSALDAAFGYTMPTMEPIGSLSEVVRLR